MLKKFGLLLLLLIVALFGASYVYWQHLKAESTEHMKQKAACDVMYVTIGDVLMKLERSKIHQFFLTTEENGNISNPAFSCIQSPSKNIEITKLSFRASPFSDNDDHVEIQIRDTGDSNLENSFLDKQLAVEQDEGSQLSKYGDFYKYQAYYFSGNKKHIYNCGSSCSTAYIWNDLQMLITFIDAAPMNEVEANVIRNTASAYLNRFLVKKANITNSAND